MSAKYARELATALDAVRLASRICRHVQADMASDAMEKKDRSPVTIADYASQAVICRTLQQAFPSDPIVAEEESTDLHAPEQREFLNRVLAEIRHAGLTAEADDVVAWIDAGNHDGTAGRYWTLDPIDGTKGFLRKEQFAVSLALLVDGVIEVAALACPNLPGPDGALGVVFTAVRGQGAEMRPLTDESAPPQPVQVSNLSDLSQARVCESVESGHSAHNESAAVQQRLGITAPPVRMDSQAKYGVLARGEAEIYLRLPTRKDYAEKIWDHAGGVLVIEEAGGRVTDMQGRPLDFRQGATLKNNAGVVATNGRLHEAVLQALKG